MLLFLFRAKSLKESESQRIPLLLAALHEKPLTAMELLDLCCSGLTADSPLPDEKTIRTDLKANTQVPSVQGYLLRDGLKKNLHRSHSEKQIAEGITQIEEDEHVLEDFFEARRTELEEKISV